MKRLKNEEILTDFKKLVITPSDRKKYLTLCLKRRWIDTNQLYEIAQQFHIDTNNIL